MTVHCPRCSNSNNILILRPAGRPVGLQNVPAHYHCGYCDEPFYDCPICMGTCDAGYPATAVDIDDYCPCPNCDNGYVTSLS